MTIGPAPMIRMVEMSVLLGIKSRGWQLENRHKKRARIPRVPRTSSVRQALAREASLDQISQPRNPQKRAINRQFGGLLGKGWGCWRRCQSVYAFALLKLRRTRLPAGSGVAAPRVAR